MSPSVLDRAARLIGEHATRHGVGRLWVTFHGGEPLLAGAAFIDRAAGRIREAVETSVDVRFGVQTNGVLLNEKVLSVFSRHQVAVGVSIDGNRASNDRHRRFADGRSSYDQVARGIELLNRQEHRALYSGLLCTIDLANDPITTYETLLAFSPPRLDLLLPHGNWSAPPPGRVADPTLTPYGDWLIAVFDRWYGAPRRETGIRLFESIISLLLGGPSRSEVAGDDPTDLVVIETEGSLEQHDSLKATVDGAAATGLNVFDHTFDDVLAHSGWESRPGRTGLGPACNSCPLVSACGGGLRAHRFHESDGFVRPSVYCPDLYALIEHIRLRITADLRALRMLRAVG
jgi:uncharacterized protein